jgi:cytochrome c biogenesis protein CcdA
MGEVGLLVAFAAGVLALLSPCSALLLPSFFAYAFAGPALLLRRTVVFYLGLALTLVPLGTGVGLASVLFYGHRDTLVAVAGWALVGLGAYQALGRGFAVPFAGRLQALASRRPGTGALSLLALGAAYGLAGFCTGPVLGAILTMAATTSMIGGGMLLAVYALGMVAPLFVLAYLWDRLGLARRSWVRGRALRFGPLRTHTTSLVSGVLFVVIGVLFLRYDGTAGIVGVFGLGVAPGTEAAVQQTVSGWAGSVPAWAPAAAVAVAAAAVAVGRTRATGTGRTRDGGRDHER